MRSRHDPVETMRFLLAGTAVVVVLVVAISCGPGDSPRGDDDTHRTTGSVDAVATEPIADDSADCAYFARALPVCEKAHCLGLAKTLHDLYAKSVVPLE